MPDERTIARIETMLDEVTRLGGSKERTAIAPNLTVLNAAPTGLSDYVIVEDDRDGDSILAVKVPGVIYATNDKVNVLFVEGTEPIALGQGSESAGASADNQTFVALNTSGDTANVGDVGYIDESGEYKTTTTAQDEVTWCVVIVGGANNADIHVSRRGRVTINYTGAAPTAGDFLTTSGTAGQAQTSTVMRSEIFAVALAAGSGGTVSALLLCERTYQTLIEDEGLLRIDNHSSSDFVATIAAAGVAGDKVYYNAPTSGQVDAITPVNNDDISKIVLHNTTQVLEAFIIDTGTDGTGNFIQVSDSADIAAWVATDAITARSQTNTTNISGDYWFDIDADQTAFLPNLTTHIQFAFHVLRDTGATGESVFLHPFEANVGAKRQRSQNTLTAGGGAGVNLIINLTDRRFCILYSSSGAATASFTLRMRGVYVASP